MELHHHEVPVGAGGLQAIQECGLSLYGDDSWGEWFVRLVRLVRVGEGGGGVEEDGGERGGGGLADGGRDREERGRRYDKEQED